MALKAIQTELVLTLLHPFSSCASEMSRKLVCSWYAIDKVILDALLRDLLQYFLAVEKYKHIYLRFFKSLQFSSLSSNIQTLMQHFSLNYI